VHPLFEDISLEIDPYLALIPISLKQIFRDPFFSLCAQGKLFFSVARTVKQKEKISNATINPATPAFKKNLFI
jgi:hypothetical protein